MRSVSRPGRSRSLRASVVNPCSAAQSTSVRVSTSRPPATGRPLRAVHRTLGQRRRGVSGSESQSRRAGEHRVIQRRVLGGEAAERVGEPAQRSAADRRRGGPWQRVGEFAEPLEGEGLDDVLHRCEVLVEHRLAVLDLGRQSAGGDRVPALALGQRAGRRGDQAATGGPLPKPSIRNTHIAGL